MHIDKGEKMNGRKIIAFLTAISLLVLLSSCSNNNNPISTQNQQPKELNAPTVSIPDAMVNSQDANAKTAVEYINLINDFKSYLPYFTPPVSSKFNDLAGEWTWTDGSLSITLTETNVNGKANWTVKLNGTDGKFNYDNWIVATAEETDDNNSGHIIVFKPVTDEMLGQLDWVVDASGKVIFNVVELGKNINVEFTSYPDQSGELKIYISVGGISLLQYKVKWTSSGSGQWWSYDNTGTEAGSGSWL